MFARHKDFMNLTRTLALSLALPALLAGVGLRPSTARAQGTAFSYQGHLNVGATPANGLYDLRFSIWNAATSGAITAGPLTNAATLVSNGLFTVTLDFGAGVFGGENCWLGMGVRSNGSGPSFTTLSPRQPLTATPYAILASGVGVGSITTEMLASGAVTTDKIAPHTVQTSELEDNGAAVYEASQRTAEATGAEAGLPFSSLRLVPATNGITPAFSLVVNSAALGSVRAFWGSEGLSRPYAYVVQTQTTGTPLDPEAQLGATASLTFTRNGRTTTFSGIVTACALSTASGSTRLYLVRIEPLLAQLALNRNYRIFQLQSAADVAAQVYLGATGGTAGQRLLESYASRETLTQYGETDLNFFNRLLEYEGICYYFNPSAAAPSPVLADHLDDLASAPYSPFPYYGDAATIAPAAAEDIRSFQNARHQSTRKSTVNSYWFQRPQASQLANQVVTGVGEQYEWLTPSGDAGDNVHLAGVRAQRQTVERQLIEGAGTAPDVRPGYSFGLTDGTGAGLDGTYVVTETRHAGFVRVTNGVSTFFYGNEFRAIPAALSFRPALQAARPLAQPCTAIVTGPAGEEIHTDQYGRVKVQFHWDRLGTFDENSSAWLRQTTPMASGSWRGMLFLPRIGDEVLVSFIMGDPDQPVITGSLYDGTKPPPYILPANKTISTIRSTGSKAQPSKVNEIKFNDLANAQEFGLQAAKDMNIIVANDLNITATNMVTLNAKNDLQIIAAKNLVLNVTSNFTVNGSSRTTINGPLAADSLAVATGSVSNLTLTGNLYLPSSSPGVGGVYFGGAPMMRVAGWANFFAGPNAGNVTLSGSYNTAVGSGTLSSNTSGANNTAQGSGALGANTTGSADTASGVNALASNTTGSSNTASGFRALFTSTTGSNNIALGVQAGYNVTTNHNNIHIGSLGTVADSGVIRLGTPGTHSTTYLAGSVQLSSNVFLNDRDIQFRGDALHGVGWYGSPKTFGGVNVNGPVLYGNGGGGLGTISGSTSNLALSWDANRNVGITGMLALGSDAFLMDKTFYLRNDSNHGLGWFGTAKPFGGATPDGPVVFGYSGGGLGILQPGAATNLALAWNSAGNVGIGTNSPNQKLVVAGNIYATGTITPNSDRNQKTDFASVDPATVLAKVAALPIQEWRFKAEQTAVRHIGPMAQDFRAAFGLGEVPTAIATVDADGVALAAIQGLNQKLEETRAENADLKARLEKLEQLLSARSESRR